MDFQSLSKEFSEKKEQIYREVSAKKDCLNQQNQDIRNALKGAHGMLKTFSDGVPDRPIKRTIPTEMPKGFSTVQDFPDWIQELCFEFAESFKERKEHNKSLSNRNKLVCVASGHYHDKKLNKTRNDLLLTLYVQDQVSSVALRFINSEGRWLNF